MSIFAKTANRVAVNAPYFDALGPTGWDAGHPERFGLRRYQLTVTLLDSAAKQQCYENLGRLSDDLIDDLLFEEYRRLGRNNSKRLNWRQRLLRFFNPTLEFPEFVGAKGGDVVDTVTDAIYEVDAMEVGFVVVSDRVANALKASKGFTFTPIGGDHTVGKFRPIGTFMYVTVFVNEGEKASWEDGTVVIGRRAGTRDWGTHIAVDVHSTISEKIAPDGTIRVTKDMRMSIGTSNAYTVEKGFMTMKLEFRSKPLWRRLLMV